MDKSKIIDEILMEWAMRSPDGLVGGHDTPENMAVLNEILNEYGIYELDIGSGDFGVGIDSTKKADKGSENKKLKRPHSSFWKKDPKTGEWLVFGHDNYAEGTPLKDIDKGIAKMYTPAQKQKLELSPELRSERIQDSIWKDMEASNGKNIGSDYVNQMEKNLKNLKISPTTKNRFYDLYDRCSLKQALEIYNGTPSEFQPFIDAINKVRHMGLGKGELAFVYMLKNVKSGGVSDVDLLNVEGYGPVEVKEVGKGKEKVRISSSTLKGFSRSEFKSAIEDLATEVRKDAGFGEFLLEVLSGKNPDETYLYPHPRTPTPAEETALKKFIKDPKTADMGKNLFRSFVIISAKIQIAPTEIETNLSKVSLNIDGSKKEFAIADAEKAKSEVQRVLNDPSTKQTINLDVTPTRGSEDISYMQIAKNLKFFDKSYNLKSISEEITKLVMDKYKGMLIVSGGPPRGDEQESSGGPNKAKIIETKDIELEFDSIAQNGIVCNVKSDLSKISGIL